MFTWRICLDCLCNIVKHLFTRPSDNVLLHATKVFGLRKGLPQSDGFSFFNIDMLAFKLGDAEFSKAPVVIEVLSL